MTIQEFVTWIHLQIAKGALAPNTPIYYIDVIYPELNMLTVELTRNGQCMIHEVVEKITSSTEYH